MTENPHDYGEGKTRQQEAEDSVYMLGLAMLIAIVFAIALLTVLVFTDHLTLL